MRFPAKVTFRRAEAKIYGKSDAYPFYRLCYCAAGKRHVRSFSTYGGANTTRSLLDVLSANRGGWPAGS